MNINIETIENVEKMLKMEIDLEITSKEVIVKCGNRCRLLSHLLHKTRMDIHCNKQGTFRMELTELTTLLDSFEEITNNPQWIIEFIEKYYDNKFMMDSTFKPIEVESQ